MPKVKVAVSPDNSETGHHGGGFMMKGGFDIGEADLSPQEFARDMVRTASQDVAYRHWDHENGERVSLGYGYYLDCDQSGDITLGKERFSEFVQVSGNEFWRNEARKFIAKTCEMDVEVIDGATLDDIGDAKLCEKHGGSL